MASLAPDSTLSSTSLWPDLTLSEVSEAVWPREAAVSFAEEEVLSAVCSAWSAVSCVVASALFFAMTSWSFCLALAEASLVSASVAFAEPWR